MTPGGLTVWQEDQAKILGRVQYKENWSLLVCMGHSESYIQWRFAGHCSVTGEYRTWPCRKHRISEYMTESELVQTAFAAALQAEEHECREFFKYAGVAVFGPHISVRALLDAAQKLDAR